jgi:hypothetical protein
MNVEYKYSIKWKANKIIAGMKMSSDPIDHRLPHSTKPGIVFYLKLRGSYRKIFQLNHTPQGKPVHDKISSEIDNNDQKLYLLFTEIQQLMESEKFYLKPSITISDVSTAIGSNDKYISLSVNKFARMNFNHYINIYSPNTFWK